MDNLKDNQIQAATMLVSGMTAKAVASALKCTPETICHWKKETEFAALLKSLRKEQLEQGKEELRNSVHKAFGTLGDIMDNSKNDEVRRKAALDILRMSGFDGDLQDSLMRYSLGLE